MRSDATEGLLIQRLRAGDAGAVSDLSDQYGTRIHQLAFRYTRNREDAEEVVQDVLLKVFQRISGFRGDAALSSWIYRITFNTAMSRRRPPFRVRTNASSPPQVADPVRASPPDADWSSLADSRLLRAEMRRTLVTALRDLPTVYRVPVLLRDVRGLSIKETASMLEIKPQTLKTRVHRGRLLLRERLLELADGRSIRSGAPGGRIRFLHGWAVKAAAS